MASKYRTVQLYSDNICPLCRKANPQSAWLCEDCGTQLPAFGVRAGNSLIPADRTSSVAPTVRLSQPAAYPGVTVEPNLRLDGLSGDQPVLFWILFFIPGLSTIATLILERLNLIPKNSWQFVGLIYAAIGLILMKTYLSVWGRHTIGCVACAFLAGGFLTVMVMLSVT